MKVTLINPESRFAFGPQLAVSYPLGLMYLASALEREKVEVEISDLSVSGSSLEETIRLSGADVFGISISTYNRLGAFRAVKAVRRIRPDARVVVGGVHATLLYRQILESLDVDMVFTGESELSLCRYIKGDPREDIPGIAFRTAERIIRNKEKVTEDIDDLPLPAFHLIDLNKYKSLFNCIDFHLITSRGCPNNCGFCSVPALCRGRYRVHGADRVLEEMEMVQGFKKNGRVMFHDDFFQVSCDRTRAICEGIIKKNIRLKWTTRSRVDSVDFDTLKLMKKSGCEGIFFGVESGSPGILKRMNKEFEPEDVKQAFAATKRSGIRAYCNIMVGYPGEDREALRETSRLLRLLQPDEIYFSPVKVFPGTGLYGESVNQGRLSDSFWLKHGDRIPFYGNRIIGWLKICWLRLSLIDGFSKKWRYIFRAIPKELALWRS